MKSLRLICAAAAQSLDLSDFHLECDICDENSKLAVVSGGIFCRKAYSCLGCQNWFHGDNIFAIYCDNRIICRKCARELLNCDGPLQPVIFRNIPNPERPPPAEAHLISPGIYECVLRKLPYWYDFIHLCGGPEIKFTLEVKTLDEEMWVHVDAPVIKYKNDSRGNVQKTILLPRQIAQIFTQPSWIKQEYICVYNPSHPANDRHCYSCYYTQSVIPMGKDGSQKWFDSLKREGGMLKYMWYGYGACDPAMYLGEETEDGKVCHRFRRY